MELLKTERLEILVNALGELRKHEIDMDSIIEPICGAPGCHAGDIWLVRHKLPGFMDLHSKDWYDFDYVDSVTLSWLKGLKHREHLRMSEWLRENQKLHGAYNQWVFYECSALTGCITVPATSKHILDFWKDVLMRHLIYKEYLKGENKIGITVTKELVGAKEHRDYAIDTPNIIKEELQAFLDQQETPDDYRFFARSVKNLTKKQKHLCLEKQVSACDFRWFAKYVKNLNEKQIQICLDEQETALDFRLFARDVKNLKAKQIQLCLDQQKTRDDYRFFARAVENLTEKQIQICLEKQVTASGYRWFAEYVKQLTKKQKQTCLEKQKTAFDFRLFAKYVENLNEKQKQFCLDEQEDPNDYRFFAQYVKNLTEKQKEICKQNGE